MRSQALFCRSKSLLKVSSAIHYHPLLSSTSRPLRLSRKEQPSRLSTRVSTRRLVSSTSASTSTDLSNSSEAPTTPSADAGASSGSEPPGDGPDKPKPRRTKVSVTASSKDTESIQLPEGLDIIWTSETEPPDPHTLPPPEIFEDALNNLLITLHPQTQHRATYASPLGPPTEPTLGLYCPIEGGEYVIDATVRELARRSGAEVLVLDAVQLAAGEWGHFGTAANSLSLPRNPLHFTSSPPLPPSNSRALPDEEDESDSPSQFFSPPQQMTLTVMTPPTMQGRTILTSSSRRAPPPSKVKTFFDALVNVPSKADPSSLSLPSTKSRPRLIYIRDFPTLAPVSSAWYPPLLSAVRERRRGPISRPSSPVGNPITIIFGMTPSLTPPVTQGSPGSGLMNLLMSRSSAPASQIPGEVKSSKLDWGEGESAEKARERRLRDRLKKWEKGDAALHEDFPRLSTTREGESAEERPEIIVIGGNNGMPGFSPMIGAGVPASSNGQPDSDSNSPFFRASTLIPSTRSTVEEQNVRMARRREINELTLRMGIGAAGGILAQENAQAIHSTDPHDKGETAGDVIFEKDSTRMWKDWGTHVEVWSNVRQIADRAIGNTLSTASVLGNFEDATLDPTAVSWSVVHKAWAAHRSSRDLRKSWLKDSSLLSKATKEHDEVKKTTEEEDQEKMDEVIERVRNEDLDSHEQRLLSCIVDSASMPTSFNQVHLPPHTIDSVRTIVSLPLLHPQAFQQGILKEHGMTGCLLFGPPGTGKTLVVRALAKEAGCRMMTISPSDVMDMYVGEGEKLVKAVFSLARRLSPCVVFLDEIDALFGARMSGRESGGAFAHRGVITEFMQEMDGLKSSKEDSVIVIGATNRPFDLDDAVLRRLPRRLLVDLPGEKEREEILKILLRDENLADDLDIRTLATKTESFSGSDLKHLCVSAALDAVKENVVLPWSRALSPKSVHPLSPSATETPIMVQAHDDPSFPSDASSTMNEPSAEVRTPTSPDLALPMPEPSVRILYLHNFTKALKEITPSSSEALGSLADLRKWNDEFGEGRRDQKRRQVWGKGRFGFTDKGNQKEEEGHVLRSFFNGIEISMPEK